MPRRGLVGCGAACMRTTICRFVSRLVQIVSPLLFTWAVLLEAHAQLAIMLQWMECVILKRRGKPKISRILIRDHSNMHVMHLR